MQVLRLCLQRFRSRSSAAHSAHYTEQEIVALLKAADNLLPAGGLRPLTYRTLFGLLAATGLRISEALHLTPQDVDLEP